MFRFYFIEPNEFVGNDSVIELRDAKFDESWFSLVARFKDLESQNDSDTRRTYSATQRANFESPNIES